MKLTIRCIEKKAIEVYKNSLKDPRVPEDYCAAIYELFIKRMKRYRERHPEIKEVSPGLMVKAVHFIIRDLRKKEKAKERQEQTRDIIQQSLYGDMEYREGQTLHSEVLNRVEAFIQNSTSARSSYTHHIHCFLLYYSYYFPMDFITQQHQKLGLPTDKLEKQIEEIRKSAISRSSLQIERSNGAINKVYTQILILQGHMKQAKNKSQRMEIYKACRALHFVQKKALLQKQSIKILPTLSEFTRITGITKDKMHYGQKVCIEALRLKRFARVLVEKSA